MTRNIAGSATDPIGFVKDLYLVEPRLTDQQFLHNQCLNVYQHGYGHNYDNESAILELAEGIYSFVYYQKFNIDPWSYEYCLSPLAIAFDNALNLDRGRLDGATLSGWLVELVARCGWDYATGQQIETEDDDAE